MIARIATYSILIFLLFSCNDEAVDPLQTALDDTDPAIAKVMENIDQYEVQIALSVINNSQDSLQFQEYEFQVNDSVYFYPASTVKFPVAVLTLEKLHHNGLLNLDVTYSIEDDSVVSSFRQDIRDIFAVSSNEAYNNLFEFLGKDNINSRLEQLGIKPARISHRLSVPNSDVLETRPINFMKDFGQSYLSKPMMNKPIEALEIQKINKGKGYYIGDSLVDQPMSFAYKNYFPISSLHGSMKRVIFPELFQKSQRFDLTPSLQQFLLESMQLLPSEAGYDSPDYYDSYVKFFMFGDSKDPMPDDIIIHNKVGYAYGYLTDCAYIVDTTNELSFILTATIHVNENGIYNDDTYEYEEVGIPFLAALGRAVHRSLLQQK